MIQPIKAIIVALSVAVASTWLVAAALGSAASGERGDVCATSPCADVSVSGHAEPQPIRRGETTNFKVTPKNDGPNAAYGIDPQVDVPHQLRINEVRLHGRQECR